jgi:hypothetical protein
MACATLRPQGNREEKRGATLLEPWRRGHTNARFDWNFAPEFPPKGWDAPTADPFVVPVRSRAKDRRMRDARCRTQSAFATRARHRQNRAAMAMVASGIAHVLSCRPGDASCTTAIAGACRHAAAITMRATQVSGHVACLEYLAVDSVTNP